MEKIIKSYFLNSEKSNFQIQLIENENAYSFVKIIQEINNSNSIQTVKLNTEVLPSVINYLQTIESEIKNITDVPYSLFNDNNVDKIINAYLKGVQIKELSQIFGLKERDIEAVLMNNQIEIVNQKTPVSRYWFRKRKK